jgi:hypothetical protein
MVPYGKKPLTPEELAAVLIFQDVVIGVDVSRGMRVELLNAVLRVEVKLPPVVNTKDGLVGPHGISADRIPERLGAGWEGPAALPHDARQENHQQDHLPERIHGTTPLLYLIRGSIRSIGFMARKVAMLLAHISISS